MTEDFSLDPQLPPALIAAVGLALLAAAAWSLYRLRFRAPLILRVILFGLRTVAVIALAIALLGPSAVSREDVAIKTPVIFLADASRSMALADEPGRSRRRQMADAAGAAAAPLARLAAACDTRTFDFGRALSLAPEWTDRAEEPLTAIGDSISAALRMTSGRPGASIVLVSDGRNTFGADPLRCAARARERGARVHAVLVGDAASQAFRDRCVNNLLCPGVVQVNATVPINAFVSAAGQRGSTMTVSMLVDDKLVETRDVVVEQDRFSAKETFLYVPKEPGQKTVKVAVSPADGEFDPTNNFLETVVRATEKEIRILYVDGKLRWDCTFLRRVLSQLPDAHFRTINLFSDPTGPRPPPSPDLAKDFNVFIIGDVTAAAVGKPFLSAIEKAVAERECGLLFLAGPENLSPASGFADSPLAPLLPFEIGDAGPLEERPSLVQITSQGQAHFALALERDDDRNMEAWKSMPRLETIAPIRSIKPAGIVLATTDVGDPLLLSQPYGKGRVLSFLAETAWKWALASEETAERNRRFWHQAVLWLARKDARSRRLWLDLPRYLYALGDPVEIAATFEDPPGSPVADGAVQVLLEGSGGPAPTQPAVYYGGAYHATLTPSEPGDYTVTVTARRGEEAPAKTSARFRVFLVNTEFEQPGASPETMLAVATAGAGTFRPLSQLPALIEELQRDTKPLTVQRVRRRTLWDRGWLMLLFISALGVEWMFRKMGRLL